MDVIIKGQYMINLETKLDELSKIDIADFTLEPLPKQVDNRGYIYVVYDSAYPDWIKVGKTVDPKKRLAAYNSDKPVKTASMQIISCQFDNVSLVEKAILRKMYEITAPSTASLEWFSFDYKQTIIDYIKVAENEFDTN